MSENTEAMNMLEDLPESAQDGQQEVDEAAATTLQEEAAETTQEARLRFPATVMRWTR